MSLSKPETREEFIQNCLCRLGFPVIEVNISPEQCEILVDQALQKFWDYHFDGQIPVYYVHVITAQDKITNTISLPDKLHGVVNILPVNNLSIPTTSGSVQTVSEIQQYYTLADLIQNGGILRGNSSALYVFRSYLETLSYTLSPLISFQFNRKTNRIVFNEPLAKIAEKAERLVIEGYEYIDPQEFPEVWNDEWLKEYATALFKRQWGENLKKFSNLPLPGGATLNGEGIYNEAVTEIERLETRLYKDLQIPINFYIA